MAIPVVVPHLGESVVEGTIMKWLKKVGDKVEKDDPLVEIATDKINIELPSPDAGIMGKILVKEGSLVPVGEEIAILAEKGESLDKLKPSGSAPSRAAEPEKLAPAAKTEPSPSSTRQPAYAPAPEPPVDGKNLSPAVRKLVRDNSLDVSRIKGSGADGRITREDVLDFMEQSPSVSTMTTPSAAPAAAPRPAPTHRVPEFASSAAGPKEEIVPMSQVRKIISEHMTKSKYTAPHVTTWDEIDFTRLIGIREDLKKIVLDKYGVKLTYMPFIAKAAVLALKEYPLINASIEGNNIRLKKYYHIGMAVGRDSGLIVVVIKDCDKKSLLQIASDMTILGEKARADRLTLDEIQGSTFTITNAGGFGALASTPIINYPEVAILGIHMIQKRAVVVKEQIAIRDMMTACMSFDHRLIDGHYAVQYLHRVKNLLENPDEWLLNVV
ncbi:MAG: dihydrolipoyllysine-residue succinyltransferase [candidate division Zixibacteria bacterium]|nr:dihydrolipoyllysine-residue succinyltransferase [candidate division Zixibacteria bacterium]